MDTIDISDLPEQDVKLIEELVTSLRKKQKPNKAIKEEGQKNKEWGNLAITSFADDWENEKDAVYDNWKEHYHVPER